MIWIHLNLACDFVTATLVLPLPSAEQLADIFSKACCLGSLYLLLVSSLYIKQVGLYHYWLIHSDFQWISFLIHILLKTFFVFFYNWKITRVHLVATYSFSTKFQPQQTSSFRPWDPGIWPGPQLNSIRTLQKPNFTIICWVRNMLNNKINQIRTAYLLLSSSWLISRKVSKFN